MGLFYTTPSDLKDVEDFVALVSQEITLQGRGYGTPGLLEDYLPEAIDRMKACRSRLLSEGRQNDLKAFKKHLLRVERHMDNGPYIRVFRPLIDEHLSI